MGLNLGPDVVAAFMSAADPRLAAGPAALAWAPSDCVFVNAVPGCCLEMPSLATFTSASSAGLGPGQKLHDPQLLHLYVGVNRISLATAFFS